MLTSSFRGSKGPLSAGYGVSLYRAMTISCNTCIAISSPCCLLPLRIPPPTPSGPSRAGQCAERCRRRSSRESRRKPGRNRRDSRWYPGPDAGLQGRTRLRRPRPKGLGTPRDRHRIRPGKFLAGCPRRSGWAITRSPFSRAWLERFRIWSSRFRTSREQSTTHGKMEPNSPFILKGMQFKDIYSKKRGGGQGQASDLGHQRNYVF